METIYKEDRLRTLLLAQLFRFAMPTEIPWMLDYLTLDSFSPTNTEEILDALWLQNEEYLAEALKALILHYESTMRGNFASGFPASDYLLGAEGEALDALLAQAKKAGLSEATARSMADIVLELSYAGVNAAEIVSDIKTKYPRFASDKVLKPIKALHQAIMSSLNGEQPLPKNPTYRKLLGDWKAQQLRYHLHTAKLELFEYLLTVGFTHEASNKAVVFVEKAPNHTAVVKGVQKVVAANANLSTVHEKTIESLALLLWTAAGKLRKNS